MAICEASENIEVFRIESLIANLRDFAHSKKITPIQAIQLASNLADTDKDVAGNEVEDIIFSFIKEMSV